MTNEERMKEIDEQIEALKREKLLLKNTQTLAGLVDRGIWCKYGGAPERRTHFGCTPVWEQIQSISKALHQPNMRGKKVKLQDLTPEQMKASADLATELIDVWNKHFIKLYMEESGDEF